jgi:hypothetical protein
MVSLDVCCTSLFVTYKSVTEQIINRRQQRKLQCLYKDKLREILVGAEVLGLFSIP